MDIFFFRHSSSRIYENLPGVNLYHEAELSSDQNLHAPRPGMGGRDKNFIFTLVFFSGERNFSIGDWGKIKTFIDFK